MPFRTFLEIQFDQAMTPPAEAMPYLLSEPGLKEPRMISRVEYDAAKHAFRIPLLMPPQEKVSLSLAGFRSATGALAEPIKLQYQVSEEELAKADREKIESGAKEPRLLDLLETMKQNRMQLTSLAERVQNLDTRSKGWIVCRTTVARARPSNGRNPISFTGMFRTSCQVFRFSDWLGRTALVVAHRIRLQHKIYCLSREGDARIEHLDLRSL